MLHSCDLIWVHIFGIVYYMGGQTWTSMKFCVKVEWQSVGRSDFDCEYDTGYVVRG